MYVEPIITIVLAFILLSYFQFPILAQISLIISQQDILTTKIFVILKSHKQATGMSRTQMPGGSGIMQHK